MTTYGNTLHDLSLDSGFLELGLTVRALGVLFLELVSPLQVPATGDKTVVKANTRDVVLPSNVAPTLLSKASASYALGAPISVRHMTHSVFCNVCSARAGRTDGDFQIGCFLVGGYLRRLSHLLLLRLSARSFLRRGDQNTI